MADKKKQSIDPELSAKRREMAIKLAKEGKFGGKQPGAGRPRKKRASEIVAEEASRQAADIVSAFKDALSDDNPAKVRLAAAKAWLTVEQDEHKLQMEEERYVDKLQTDQLITLIEEKLQRITSAGIAEDVIEAEIVDDTTDRSGGFS